MLRRIKRICNNRILKNKTVVQRRFSFRRVKITSHSTCFWAQGCGRRERAVSPSVVRCALVLPWGCWPALPGFLGSLCPSALSRPATVHSFPDSEWDWPSSGSQSELHLFGPCGHSGKVISDTLCINSSSELAFRLFVTLFYYTKFTFYYCCNINLVLVF